MSKLLQETNVIRYCEWHITITYPQEFFNQEGKHCCYGATVVATRVRKPGVLYGPDIHRCDRADDTEFVTAVADEVACMHDEIDRTDERQEPFLRTLLQVHAELKERNL